MTKRLTTDTYLYQMGIALAAYANLRTDWPEPRTPDQKYMIAQYLAEYGEAKSQYHKLLAATAGG